MTVDLQQVFQTIFNDHTRSDLPECIQDSSSIMGVISLELCIMFGVLNVGYAPFQMVFMLSSVGIFIAILGLIVGLLLQFFKLLKKD